jgi:hypothetical protein
MSSHGGGKRRKAGKAGKVDGYEGAASPLLPRHPDSGSATVRTTTTEGKGSEEDGKSTVADADATTFFEPCEVPVDLSVLTECVAGVVAALGLDCAEYRGRACLAVNWPHILQRGLARGELAVRSTGERGLAANLTVRSSPDSASPSPALSVQGLVVAVCNYGGCAGRGHAVMVYAHSDRNLYVLDPAKVTTRKPQKVFDSVSGAGDRIYWCSGRLAVLASVCEEGTAMPEPLSRVVDLGE